MASRKKTKKKIRRRFQKWLKEHKIAVALSLIGLVIILAVFGVKLFLYVNLLLGNDVIVKLDINKRDISLVHGEEEKLIFEAKVTTNPFCNSLCRYSFRDISDGEAIDEADFMLSPAVPLKKEYLIKPPPLGEGLELYRFDMECRSLRTALCHTGEEPSTRSILVTVKYGLNDEEKELKENLKIRLDNLTGRLIVLKAEQAFFEALSKKIEEVFIPDDKINDKSTITENRSGMLHNRMLELKKLWEAQDYNALSKSLASAEGQFQKNEGLFREENRNILSAVLSYNKVISTLWKTKKDLEDARGMAVVSEIIGSNETKRINETESTNETKGINETESNNINEEVGGKGVRGEMRREINETIRRFNELASFKQKTTIAERGILQEALSEKTRELMNLLEEQIRKEVIKKELELDINYDLLCSLVGRCISHPSIEERANSGFTDSISADPISADSDLSRLSKICSSISDFKDLALEINLSLNKSFISQDYPEKEQFWANISQKLRNMDLGIRQNYLRQLSLLPQNSSNTINTTNNTFISNTSLIDNTIFIDNTILINELLKANGQEGVAETIETEDYPEYNITPALVSELVGKLVNKRQEGCNLPNTTSTTSLNTMFIVVNEIMLNRTMVNEIMISEVISNRIIANGTIFNKIGLEELNKIRISPEMADETAAKVNEAVINEAVSGIVSEIVSEIISGKAEEAISKKISGAISGTMSEMEFREPLPKCCISGKCEECCIGEKCRNDPSTFPIVFLHGHAVEKSLSAEYSLEGFNKIQNRLEEDGYLNAGAVTLYTSIDAPKGVWGLYRIPLTIRASYYFDVFKQPENYIVMQAKSENIDTYAIRLKELIDIIKYKTGRAKVNIIAFSMGGLVTRRYLQIFGVDSVNKVVLIGTPNHGIAGSILDYCPLRGEKLECRDMNSESLFINKLNREPLPEIPFYNIIGTGCRMEGGTGDGAVLEQSAWLEGADNYLINSSCTSIAHPLHLTLRDIELHPEVYSIIREALNK